MEDAMDLNRDIEWFFDLRNPTMRKMIKLEAAARWQTDMQEMIKNMKEDFGFDTWREFVEIEQAYKNKAFA